LLMGKIFSHHPPHLHNCPGTKPLLACVFGHTSPGMISHNAASEGGGHATVLHISSDFTLSIILTATGNHCSQNRCFMLISGGPGKGFFSHCSFFSIATSHTWQQFLQYSCLLQANLFNSGF
jgi:hypothetical protein